MCVEAAETPQSLRGSTTPDLGLLLEPSCSAQLTITPTAQGSTPSRPTSVETQHLPHTQTNKKNLRKRMLFQRQIETVIIGNPVPSVFACLETIFRFMPIRYDKTIKLPSSLWALNTSCQTHLLCSQHVKARGLQRYSQTLSRSHWVQTPDNRVIYSQ